MAKDVKGLLAHCKQVVKDNVQYIYGCKMEILTQSKYDYLKRCYGSMIWNSDKSKIGKMCCDCSGLISSYTGILRGSTNYKDTATQVATIYQLKTNWKNYVGWGLWMQGHIGVVSDTEGYYYALDGSARNSVHRPLKDNNWLYVIKLKDIDYSSQPQVVDTTTNVKTSDIDVYYMTYSNSKWNRTIKNCNDTSSDGYAGINNVPNKAFTIKSSKGVVTYRVHTKNGGWGAFKNGNDVCDSKNGYAGNGRDDIDGIQMEINRIPNYNIMYRVSLVGQNDWLDWVTNWNNTNEGYAGIFGKAIDKVQVKVVKYR